MKSKIKDLQVLLRIGILILSGFIIYISIHRILNELSFLGFFVFSGILFIFNFIKLIRLKEIILSGEGFRIIYPYRFTTLNYSFSEIIIIDKKVIKGSGASGPGFIEQPSFQLSILLENKKKFIFSTKENLNLQEVERELSNKISK